MTSPSVTAADSGASYWGTAVSDMQEDLTISGGRITGTLKKLTNGALVDTWGEGYFMALKFSNITDGAVVRVGLYPSQGSGLVPLDADLDGVFKVTDKYNQVFEVVSELDGQSKTDIYKLNRLVMQ